MTSRFFELLIFLGACLLLLAFVTDLPMASFPSEEPANPPEAKSATISGTVRIESKIPTKTFPLSFYSRKGASAKSSQTTAPTNEIENVVVYLEDFSLRKKPGALPTQESGEPTPAIRQLNEMFLPHVLPITIGTVVQFPNEDPFFHNVFSLSGTKSFDLGRYPKNHTRSVKFDRPGIVKVFCHIHSHMSAVILVFDHPYFAVPHANGSFEIKDIPTGQYTVVFWHERLKPFKQNIQLLPGASLSLDATL
ncbi:MAG: carboxypeptidase regulatory-like domain-containing protein [Terriglobia bacterium]